MERINREGVDNVVKNGIHRAGTVFSLYGELFEFVEKMADLLIKNQTSIVFLKDVVFRKNDQATVFRRMKSVNLSGNAIDFIAWLSLAKVVVDNWKDIFNDDIVQVFKNIIVNPGINKTDMVNMLHLFSSNSLMFYHYLNFEIKKRLFPFEVFEELDENSLVTLIRLSGLVSRYKELFFWEQRTGRKHPARDMILEDILKG